MTSVSAGSKKPINLTLIIYAIFLSGFGYIIATWPGGTFELIQSYGLFFFLGLAGALVANSTGAGGGVIFIPFFAALGFTATESIATSIAIQCFGMTAGTFSWLKFLHLKSLIGEINIKPVIKILWLAGPTTIAGVLFSQYVLPHPSIPVETLFGCFSIVFGLILFAFTLKKGKRYEGEIFNVNQTQAALITITCFLGGILTAWISVGVGEAIALLLFFLGFPAYFAVAIGVFTSSLSVLTAVNYHIAANNISVEVVLFAGMAAFIGGYIARYITNKLGGFNLKLFFAVWIFVSGLYTL